MRSSFVLALTSLVACTASDDKPQSKSAFKVESSEVTLQPGEEFTKCFYFHLPNTVPLQVNKWISDMTPGSHHMIVFASLGTQPPDGTIDDCDGAEIPVPVYGTQIPHEELQFPTDDGYGLPLAQQIEPGTAGFFQMHYYNASDEVLTTHVELEAFALPEGTEFTRTETFATYNNDISIPPHATNFKVSATCEIFDKKFWSMSSHSHKQSVATTISDGGNVVFTSSDWEHPGSEGWKAPDFYQFQGTTLTWECTYNNTGANAERTIESGTSARTDEMCMATGYFFPAAGPRGCFIDNGSCQCLL